MRARHFFGWLVLGIAAAMPASAQPYPARPITFVVPYPPGGPLDAVARLLGQKMTERMGQPVIVENKPGAGGNIGADAVARAAPDGYTILMGAVATHVINPTLYKSIRYDPIRDFTPITLLAITPNVLVVNPKLDVRNVAQLIAMAKKEPGKLAFASGSIGSAGHLAGELFKAMAGVDMVHVPYKGAAPATTDLIGGQVDLMFDNLASATPLIKAGKVRALAVTTLRRAASMPELPTISESGLTGFDINTWFGVLAPASLPKPILDRLHAELVAALAAPDVHRRIVDLGAEPVGNRPEEFLAFIQTEIPKYAKLIRAARASVD